MSFNKEEQNGTSPFREKFPHTQTTECDKYKTLLQKYWGYEDFRGIQREIIESIGKGKDTLGLMPTGGGKSITFQIPAMAQPGTCLVITPLIALMKDQVTALRKRGIKATALYSGQSREENLIALDNCILGDYKFLYISPERLSSETFLTKIKHMNISFITVDEAHCINQWGYDFRPSYLQISKIREIKPNTPILALTATATPEVAKDIQERLGFKEENVFRMSFERKNLAYVIYHTDYSMNGLLKVLEGIKGSCIIYTRNRQYCQELSEQLNKLGHKSTFYHAGLSNGIKDSRQNDWQNNNTRIMVATNAFGMGIDKPDVRLVIHLDIPDSIEEYFQEAGRAGRDGQKSYAIIILDGKELEISKRRLGQRFPKEEYIKDIYEKICFFLQIAEGDGLNVTREFNMEQFCRNFKAHPIMARNAIEILKNANFVDYFDEDEGASRLVIRATRNELYAIVERNEEKIINSILRHYGGIFINYIILDEELICHETGLDMDTVYHTLVGLSKKGVLDYIPKKRIPKITFKRRRIDKEKICIPNNVYEVQKEKYAYRLNAIQEYCTITDECRSKLLLKYFGETKTHNCGICDYCRNQSNYSLSNEEYESIRRVIINQLKEGPIKAYNINTNGINSHKLNMTLDRMRANEEITNNGLTVYLRSKA